jgi:hypothetical protein
VHSVKEQLFNYIVLCFIKLQILDRISSLSKNKMDLGNQDMKKNSCKKYYKNILNKDYEEIFDNKLKSIDNNSKLFLFKALKSKNKSEFYLKYPDFEIRRLICKFRLSDHSLAIETGRYKKNTSAFTNVQEM